MKHMNKTTIETLWMILDLFEELCVTYWLDGGWGVDALYGKQTREHRDIDINFDAAKTEVVLRALKERGYVLETDWLPVRAEFSHSQYGYLDVHPFDIGEGIVKQVNPEGGFWEFPNEYFGKAAVILPHGVLFRGNAEETIRKSIVDKGWIKGIISLPPNLFYGTGIPACILVIDKEGAENRQGIFMINASRNYVKDGNKNRLREQDIRCFDRQ